MTNDRMEHLYFLKNQSVTAITFMADCLQVELQNATLTCYPGPVVLGAAADYTLNHPLYKNEICLLMGQPVKAITETEKGLVLTFTDRELLFEIEGDREVLVLTNNDGDWFSYPNLDVHGPE